MIYGSLPYFLFVSKDEDIAGLRMQGHPQLHQLLAMQSLFRKMATPTNSLYMHVQLVHVYIQLATDMYAQTNTGALGLCVAEHRDLDPYYNMPNNYVDPMTAMVWIDSIGMITAFHLSPYQ